MRFSAVIVALSAAFATASAAHLERRQTGYASSSRSVSLVWIRRLTSLSLFPGCALPCLTSADRGSCAADDTKCLCNNQTFVNETTLCFEKNCTGDDLDKSIAAAVEMCRSVVSLRPIHSLYLI